MGQANYTLSKRSLKLGHETYFLANIARIRIVDVPKPPNAEKGNLRLAIFSAGVVFAITAAIANSSGSSAIGSIGFIAAIALGIWIYVKTKVPYSVRYALILETTGEPKVGLLSSNRDTLEYVRDSIAKAIEEPLENEKVYTVENVILGDQYNQLGDFNIGKVANP